MAYIGREPIYGKFERQSLTADGSTTTFSFWDVQPIRLTIKKQIKAYFSKVFITILLHNF